MTMPQHGAQAQAGSQRLHWVGATTVRQHHAKTQPHHARAQGFGATGLVLNGGAQVVLELAGARRFRLAVMGQSRIQFRNGAATTPMSLEVLAIYLPARAPRFPSLPIPMKCSTCQWHNPGEATHCVMCRAPLARRGEPDFASDFAQPSPVVVATPVAVYLATDLSRTAATVIDGVQMLVSAALWLVVVWDVSFSIWLKLLGAVVLFFLPALLDAGPGSLGKRCLKIQVVTTHGEKPPLVISIWRHFIKYVLHIALPIVWKLVEPWLTGGRYLHDVCAGTTVIERLPASARATRAAPELFHEALIMQAHGVQAGAAPQAPVRADVKNARQQVTRASRAFDVFKNLLAWCIACALLWLFVPAVWSLYKESQDPTMSAVSDAKAATKKLTHLLSQRFEQGKSLELDWSDPALAALEAEMGAVFTSITTEPSGPVTLQIKRGPVAGKHIVLSPEYNFSKKSIKKWTCGSPDIERALLPTGCKATLSTAPTTP